MTREVASPFPSRRDLRGSGRGPSPAVDPTDPVVRTPGGTSDTACPLPSRRSLHVAPTRAASPSSSVPSHAAPPPPATPGTVTTGEAPFPAGGSSRRPRHGVGRASVLVALGAMTVAVPLSGFVGPDSSVDLPARALGGPVGGATWADAGASDVADADSLGATVAAASRSRVRTPLETTKCLAADTASDGTRQVVVEADDVVYPLTQGSYQVTSGFGMRISPVTGQALMHEGVDMSAPLGTPIHAVADGEVVELTSDYRSGTYLRIRHTASDGSVFYSAYAHEYMADILVAVGDHVTAGQQIGAVGSNGWSTGPHLHFEIHDASDTPVEPLSWMQSHGAAFIGEECS